MKLRSAWIVSMLAVIWLATPSTASAQPGVLVGLNFANIKFDADDFGDTNLGDLEISGDRRTGFVGGVSFNAPIRDVFSVEVDALVAQKGAKRIRFTVDDSDFVDPETIKLTYLDFPVLARINLPGSGPVRVHLLAGPSFNFKVGEKVDDNDADDTEDNFEKFETALVVGGGVHLGMFRVDVRYGLSLSNIVKDPEESGLTNFTGKNRVFSILVGFGS